MPRPLLPALLALVVAAVAAGCGEAGEGASPAAPSASDLAGRTYVSDAVRGRELVPDTRIELRFEADAFSAAAGCNTIAGPLSVRDGALRTDDELMRTMIGCDAERERQDQWLHDLLSAGPELTLDGERLTLTGDDAAIELHETGRRGTHPPLTGTSWTLESIGDREGTVSSVPAGVRPPTLTLDADGASSVFAGCNRGGGMARVRDDEGLIDFGPLGLTRKLCDADAMAVERTVAAILDGTTAYSFDGPRMTIARKGDFLVWRAE